MAPDEDRDRTGGCLCGAVRYRVTGPMRPVVQCHCGQCRRWAGHAVAASGCRQDDLSIDDPDGVLAWFDSSPGVRRGFCGRCGSKLFWRRDDGGTVSVMAGTVDRPTGLALALHIFTRQAGDYYAITDDLPRAPGHGTTPAIDAWQEATGGRR